MASKSKTYSIGLFLLFCVIAGITWFLIRYRSTYTHEQQFKLSLIDQPIDVEILDPEQELTFSADVTASGFYLIYLDFAKPTIEVPFTEYVSVQDSLATVQFEPLKSIMEQQLPSAVDIQSFTRSQLDIPLKVTESKRIPIIVDVNVETTKGYRIQGQPILDPDSLTITGEAEELARWDSLGIGNVRVQLDRDSVSKKIDLGSYISLRHTPDSINITARGIKMTEGKITKAVEILNAPQEVKIRLIPDEVRITYRSSTTDFPKINAQQITPVIDLKNVQQDNFSTIPEVQGLGSFVSDYTLTPNQVQVLIIK